MQNLDLYVHENDGVNFTMDEAREILSKHCHTKANKEFGDLFKVFMYRIGATKLDKRKKDTSNTYEIEGHKGKYTIDRTEYIYYDKNGQYKDVFNYAFCIIIQKEQGNFLSIYMLDERGINTEIYRISYWKEEIFEEELFAKFLERYQEFFRVFKDYRNYQRSLHYIKECRIERK